MGLDSIELVMEIEQYFSIKIPDAEAEKILTVQNMLDCVANHLKVKSENLELRDKIFSKIETAFMQLGWAENKIKLSDLAYTYIKDDTKENWVALKSLTQLSIPRIQITRNSGTKISDHLKALLSWTPFYQWEEITISQFVNAICAKNYETLVVKEDIKNKYEIYVAIVGITVDKIGVDYYEVSPEKSFTSDLGVD